MNEAAIVLQQILIMFLLTGIGIVASKMKLIDTDGTKPIADVLLTIILPGLIIKSYQRELVPSHLAGLGTAFFLGIFIHGLAVILSKIFISERGSREYAVDRFCTVYPNVAFMSFPLFYAIMGDIGIFYGTAFVAATTVFTWTHGIILLSGKNKPGIKKLILNPGIIGLAIGLFLYFGQLPLPYVVTETLNYVSNLNTPLAMIISGIFLSDINITGIFSDMKIIKVIALRLVCVPFLILIIFKSINLSSMADWAPHVQLVSLIASGCPTAAFTIMFTAKFGFDGSRAARIVALTTGLSVITLPVITYLNSLRSLFFF